MTQTGTPGKTQRTRRSAIVMFIIGFCLQSTFNVKMRLDRYSFPSFYLAFSVTLERSSRHSSTSATHNHPTPGCLWQAQIRSYQFHCHCTSSSSLLPPILLHLFFRVARDRRLDVVLVDTAGRMQDNEPLMRALASVSVLYNLIVLSHCPSVY